jgi:hypothetical protein
MHGVWGYEIFMLFSCIIFEDVCKDVTDTYTGFLYWLSYGLRPELVFVSLRYVVNMNVTLTVFSKVLECRH